MMHPMNTFARILFALSLVLVIAAIAMSTTTATSGNTTGGVGGAFQESGESAIPPVPRPIYIYAGSCAELGDVQWPLNNLTSPDGEDGGSNDADRTEYSFTANVPLTIDQMLSGEYAINVHESGEKFENSLSCGNIGGVPDGVGTLVIGLRELDRTGVTGIAVLSPSPADTSMTYVSVFISGRSLGDAIGTIGVTPPPLADDAPPVIDNPPVDGGRGSGDDDDGGDDDDSGGDD
jgi:hypothetical protein